MSAVTDHRLACPTCRTPLAHDGDLSCPTCGATYTRVDEILLLAPHATDEPHKAEQEAFFTEHADEDWELVRPAGAPRFHEWLIHEKFRRATEDISSSLPGASVLVVCGGSGMDAELIAAEGAATVTSDLSYGTAMRAAERARRARASFASVVADAERLPFGERSFDFVYVHDGLHHLEDPRRGVEEMCRVARLGVVISEPARAAITRGAVKLGLAENVEEAGNFVARLDPAAVASLLRNHGFEVVRSARYAMLYRHRPGLPMRILSAPGVFQAAVVAFSLLNAAIGRFGNKLVVVAIRK
jgi:SAM-dependent methyltransferase